MSDYSECQINIDLFVAALDNAVQHWVSGRTYMSVFTEMLGMCNFQMKIQYNLREVTTYCIMFSIKRNFKQHSPCLCVCAFVHACVRAFIRECT